MTGKPGSKPGQKSACGKPSAGESTVSLLQSRGPDQAGRGEQVIGQKPEHRANDLLFGPKYLLHGGLTRECPLAAQGN